MKQKDTVKTLKEMKQLQKEQKLVYYLHASWMKLGKKETEQPIYRKLYMSMC